MSKKFLFFAFFILLLNFGCQVENKAPEKSVEVSETVSKKDDSTSDFSIELKTNPSQSQAEEQIDLTFTIKNPQGETVKDLQIVHEKPLHLLVVSEDLAEFYHLHPEPQADGTLKTSFAFKNGGNFKLYADFTPKNSRQVVKTLDLKVSGNPREKEELKADEKQEKVVEGLKVVMNQQEELKANKDSMINFSVFDSRSGELAKDLQKYLGESAHFVIISQDLNDFVHAHPMSKDNVKSEHTMLDKNNKLMNVPEHSMVSIHVKFPKTGLYKIWAQFQRNGRVIDVPFVVNVKEAEKSLASKLENVQVPADAYRITVTKEGFVPQEVSLKMQPKKLAFIRQEEGGCADEVVIKELNIRKKLPLGEVVVIDVSELKGNVVNFSCGMDMYKGKILVE